ncbi:MAG: hypothetical protein BGO41_12995 [Clostridiales bacterium 38-18]|nr:MAG: hypothetical protein BGO41_12995 [Clostridiales bacterium 38-18]
MKRNIEIIKIKWVALLLVLVMVVPIGFSDVVKFSDVSSKHWAYKMIHELNDADIIMSAETFGLGSNITESNLVEWLGKIKLNANYQLIFEQKHNLTRIEAIEVFATYLRLNKGITLLGEVPSPFVDTDESSALLSFASNVGWVSVNSTQTFRPNQLIKKEEATAILYKIYSQLTTPLSELHTYYAISSYSQADLTDDVDSLSYGWARLEFDKTKQSVLLNMTSSNSNEYRVPTGYAAALDATSNNDASKQLMVFVKDETRVDPVSGKSVSLAESILLNDALTQSAVDQIIDSVKSNVYNIHFNGVVLDFENLKGDAVAEAYNNFVAEISKKLKAENLTLYIAVHPERNDSHSYFDGYDFRTLGTYADHIILMAHDYYAKKLSTTDMQLGYTVTPLSPIDEVFYALEAVTNPKDGVEDSSKVLLQVSFDTVQWQSKEGAIINSTPYHPSYQSVFDRAAKTGTEINYSINLESPYLTFTENQIRNIIWFEDEKSIQAKIDLAKIFNTGGISVWRLGTIPNFDSSENDLSQLENIQLNVWQQILKNF